MKSLFGNPACVLITYAQPSGIFIRVLFFDWQKWALKYLQVIHGFDCICLEHFCIVWCRLVELLNIDETQLLT